MGWLFFFFFVIITWNYWRGKDVWQKLGHRWDLSSGEGRWNTSDSDSWQFIAKSCDILWLMIWRLCSQDGIYIHIQFSPVAQLCLTLCESMDCRTPGLPVHHQLPEFTQTYLHWVGDATQPSHPLSSPSPPALNLSQHQGLLNESALRIRWPKYGVSVSTTVLPMNTQDWSPLGWTGWISLQSKGLSRVFSNTTVQKPQFFGTQPSL